VKGYRKSRDLGDGDLHMLKDDLRTEHEMKDPPPEDPDAPGPVAAAPGGGADSSTT